MVHRTNLHTIHHSLQLGAGSGVRLPVACSFHGDRLARARGHRPEVRRRDAALVIPSLPRSLVSRCANAGYVGAFFVFLFVPLVVVAVFAFNDANYPAPPWGGFTLDWFLGGRGRTGLFADGPLLKSVGTSVIVAAWVTLLSVAIGTANAVLLERA